ncbi:hypothetical protein CJ030_MR1G025590 [Morella rubra]|uniref:Uncharacterized protein n=1 Tax=Morella rubra TaxID=262757 RepID=A0A6A1WLB6_9ROSI|nr:hypothetical protein CJ030_MR1G025590 [Morella rubra]
MIPAGHTQLIHNPTYFYISNHTKDSLITHRQYDRTGWKPYSDSKTTEIHSFSDSGTGTAISKIYIANRQAQFKELRSRWRLPT